MDERPVIRVTIQSAEPENLISRFRGESLRTIEHNTISVEQRGNVVLFQMPPESMTDEVSDKLGMIAKMFEGEIEMEPQIKD